MHVMIVVTLLALWVGKGSSLAGSCMHMCIGTCTYVWLGAQIIYRIAGKFGGELNLAV